MMIRAMMAILMSTRNRIGVREFFRGWSEKKLNRVVISGENLLKNQLPSDYD